ncbi:MAG TPA: transcriptional regulator [Bacteroidales bacterium]|nr:transcriptional regulator [Bacteroidales bacterium]
MVKSKTELFEPETQHFAELFKALAHPARIAILKYLAETKMCITGDISEELPLSRSTVNQHLAELKKAGLIQGHIEGNNTKYCLNPEGMNHFKNLFSDLFVQLEIPENIKC